MSEEEELRPMNSWGKSTSSHVSSNKELTMRKALYYDFMLYQRTLKPFNSFLIKSGLEKQQKDIILFVKKIMIVIIVEKKLQI